MLYSLSLFLAKRTWTSVMPCREGRGTLQPFQPDGKRVDLVQDASSHTYSVLVAMSCPVPTVEDGSAHRPDENPAPAHA